ncbi:acetate non-utilizing protein 9 [Halocaridina rubra]|uniref:Succinate dehydrogenase assembly factor 3 n=1 Tax=Halocaridina rubra TaxID=373956 RepID=A0AAN8X4U7_HALRR
MGGVKAAQQAFTHHQRVRLLYKTVLKLHRGLPLELQALGDQYARDEFKRHKEADTEQAKTFMVEWTNYAISIAKQLGVRGAHTAKDLGSQLSDTDLEKFSDEQIYQLYELHEAATAQKKKEENTPKS